jgi:hypothetical protein
MQNLFRGSVTCAYKAGLSFQTVSPFAAPLWLQLQVYRYRRATISFYARL